MDNKFIYSNNTNKNLNNNSEMAEFYSIFVQMLFDIRFDVEYFDLKPSFLWSVYYSTWIIEVCDSPRGRISNRDPDSPMFDSMGSISKEI